MLLRSLALLAVLPCFAACGKLEIRVTRTVSVPSTLLGEWTGTWTSAENGGGGSVAVRVRSFENQPLVGMAIDNPCVTPRQYEFVLAGNRIELRSNGVTLFQAVLAAEQTMVGDYQCAEDHGTWQVTWQRALPPVLDVTGTWAGAVDAGAQGEVGLLLHLTQTVRNGLLAGDGAVELPGVMTGTLPLAGVVDYGVDQFQLLMATPQALSPSLQLIATGTSATMVIENGIVLANLTPTQPAQTATWHAALQPQ